MKKSRWMAGAALFLAALSLIVAAVELYDKDPSQSVYAKYYFTPAFKASVPFDTSHLKAVEDDAKTLVSVVGNPGLSDGQFEESLEGNLSGLNEKDTSIIWAHSDACGSEPLNATARKAVICVRLPDRLFLEDGNWSLIPITFTFALDFSEDAFLTANGMRPKKCVDGTPYGACSADSDGMFCSVSPEGDYHLIEDCRGFDDRDPSDDCGCPAAWVCGSEGVCNPPI